MTEETSKVNPLLSIIVPVYNGSNTISSCIKFLENLDYPKEKYEIIIVDNNSDDNTSEIVRTYNVKYLFEEKRGQAAARNLGATHAKGEILGFVDADCLVGKNWAAEVENYFKDNPVSVVIGFCDHSIKNTAGEMYAYDYEKDWERRSVSGDRVSAISGANFAIKKDLFWQIGGFDEDFLVQEDIELGYRLTSQGHSIMCNPNMKVKHLYSDNLDTLVNKMCKSGYYEYILFKKYINDSNITSLMPSFKRFYFRFIVTIKSKYKIRGLVSIVQIMMFFPLFLLKVLFLCKVKNYLIYRVVLSSSLFKGKLLAILNTDNG